MVNKTSTVSPTSNILSSVPAPGTRESIKTQLRADGVRVERIVSLGQASPAGFMYDQDEAEWVLVMRGRARLTIEGEAEDRALGPGDSLFLPAHCRHRVAWTPPGEPTVWLTIFIDTRHQSWPAPSRSRI